MPDGFSTIKPAIIKALSDLWRLPTQIRPTPQGWCCKLPLYNQILPPELPLMNIDILLNQVESAEVISVLQNQFCRIAAMFSHDLPSEQAEARIYRFQVHYIKAVAESIREVRQLGSQFNLTALLDPYLELASSHDEAAREALRTSEFDSLHQFLTLLQAAYICHRLIEELDDRIENFIGIPLTHVNLMNANLITHEILGDRFANRLDGIVTSLFQASAITKALIEAQLDKDLVQALQKSDLALSGQPVRCLAADHQLIPVALSGLSS